ncbi:mucin-17-like [Rhincodon typus]|uniref:mucin-17-like n=1 Tax=Rhincodon typus TaxID=259920 RepID=UPI00202E1374|nr:mucin-17-like [Rhincodon typus]
MKQDLSRGGHDGLATQYVCLKMDGVSSTNDKDMVVGVVEIRTSTTATAQDTCSTTKDTSTRSSISSTIDDTSTSSSTSSTTDDTSTSSSISSTIDDTSTPSSTSITTSSTNTPSSTSITTSTPSSTSITTSSTNTPSSTSVTTSSTNTPSSTSSSTKSTSTPSSTSITISSNNTPSSTSITTSSTNTPSSTSVTTSSTNTPSSTSSSTKSTSTPSSTSITTSSTNTPSSTSHQYTQQHIQYHQHQRSQQHIQLYKKYQPTQQHIHYHQQHKYTQQHIHYHQQHQHTQQHIQYHKQHQHTQQHLQDHHKACYHNYKTNCENVYHTHHRRNGSILVDHDVIINSTNSAEFTPDYLSNTAEQLKDKLEETPCLNVTGDKCNGLEFDTSHIKVAEPVITGDCASQVPENLKEYYRLTMTNDGVICASICNEERNDSLKCGNGKCGMTNKGVKCYCDNTEGYWYLGDFCNIPIHKNGLIGGLSAALILFLLGLLAFAVYTVWFQRGRKQYRRQREDEQNKIILEKWAEDDFEYCNPSTITVYNKEDTSYENSTGERDSSDFSVVNMKLELNSNFNFNTGEVKIQRPQINIDNHISHL